MFVTTSFVVCVLHCVRVTSRLEFLGALIRLFCYYTVLQFFQFINVTDHFDSFSSETKKENSSSSFPISTSLTKVERSGEGSKVRCEKIESDCYPWSWNAFISALRSGRKSNSWGLCQLPSDVNRAQPWSGDTYHSCTGRLNEIPSQNVDDLYTRLGSDVEID